MDESNPDHLTNLNNMKMQNVEEGFRLMMMTKAKCKKAMEMQNV